MKKERDDKFIEEINRICAETWQIPQERLSNSMTIPNSLISLWFRFNNYRRQIQVKEKDNSTLKSTIAILRTFIPKKNIIFSEHTKLITVMDYMPNITVQYGRNILTGIWKQNYIDGHKEGYLVERQKINDIHSWVDSKTEEIKTKIDVALTGFIKTCNLRLRYKRLDFQWKRKELEIKGEKFIDSIPKECIIHDTVGKKVYEEGFEFNDELYVKNYIKNRAIEDISPAIAAELEKIGKHIYKEVSDLDFIRQMVQEANEIDEMILKMRQDIQGIRRMKSLSPEEMRLVETDIQKKWGN